MDYKSTLNLPRTDFPMRGNLPAREPEILTRWKTMGVYERLQKANAGKAKFFQSLSASLLGGDSTYGEYTTLAAELEMTQGAVKTAAHRMRRRFRELLREEIAQTVADPEEIDEEVRHLFDVLGS